MNIWIIYVSSGIFLSFILYNRIVLLIMLSKIEAYYSVYKKKYLPKKKNIVYNFLNEKLGIHTKLIQTNDESYINLISCGNNNSDFKISKIKFMLIEVKTNKNNYTLNFYNNNKKYNFYLENNIFDYEFLIWFLDNIMNTIISINDIQNVNIMDHKYKLINLDSSNRIILKEFNYELISNYKDKND